VLTNTDLYRFGTIFERNRPFVYIGKNKSDVFIILLSVIKNIYVIVYY